MATSRYGLRQRILGGVEVSIDPVKFGEEVERRTRSKDDGSKADLADFLIC